jgi:hypothetical protein
MAISKAAFQTTTSSSSRTTAGKCNSFIVVTKLADTFRKLPSSYSALRHLNYKISINLPVTTAIWDQVVVYEDKIKIDRGTRTFKVTVVAAAEADILVQLSADELVSKLQLLVIAGLILDKLLYMLC